MKTINNKIVEYHLSLRNDLFGFVNFCHARHTSRAPIQIAAENFPPGDVARSVSGELTKDGHRPSNKTSCLAQSKVKEDAQRVWRRVNVRIWLRQG